MATRTRIVGLLLVVLFASLLPLWQPVAAQEAEDDTIRLQVLRDPHNVDVVPIVVELVSPRAIEGTLTVENHNLNMLWELPLAVAANTPIREVIGMPVAFGQIDLEASLIIEGDEVSSERLRNGGPNLATNAVGLLGVESELSSVALTPAIGQAVLLPLDDFELLTALDSVVVTSAGLSDLTADERAELLRWVATGRQLLVADPVGSIDRLLPSAWLADGDETDVLADAGLIRYVDPVTWADHITPSIRIQDTQGFSDGDFALMSDAGFEVPGLGILLIILLLYVLIAGPLTYFLLARRDRRLLTWLVVPGLAVLFTLGVAGIGSLLTAGRGNGHATVVELTSVGSVAYDSILIASDGRQTVELPPGWSVRPKTGNSFFEFESGSSPMTMRSTASESSVEFDIEPGSGATAVFVGPADQFDSALVVDDVSLDGNIVSGTITNRSGEGLVEVVAVMGQHAVEVEDLGDGSEATFSLNLAGQSRRFAEMSGWPRQNFDNFGFEPGFGGPPVGRDDRDGPVNASAWSSWRRARVGTSVPGGFVTVVGWSRSLDASALDGSGRTALVARAKVPASAEVPASLVRNFLVSAPGVDPNFGFQARAEVVSQHLRPPGSDTGSVALDLRAEVIELQVWVDGEWRSFDVENAGRETIDIPAEAWSGDVLWVRRVLAEFFGESGQLQIDVVTRTDQTLTPTLLEAGQRSEREGFFEDGGFEGGFGDGPAPLGMETTITLDGDGTFRESGFLEGTHDAWILEMTEGQSMTVWMDAQNGNFFGGGELDPLLVVFDPNGRQVVENDDFNGLNSRVDFVAGVAGSYTIEARPLGGMMMGGGYDIIFEGDVPEAES